MNFLSRNPNRGAASKPGIRDLLYTTLIIPSLLLTALWIGYTITHSMPEDFRVFYESASVVLDGNSPYRTYGPIALPYWYLPWLSWFYIPLALFPNSVAYILYLVLSLLCGLVSIIYLCNAFLPGTNLLEQLFLFCMTLSLCWLLFRVGQMDFILLGITTLMIHLLRIGRPQLAGLLTPILLFKPHLYILFLPFALLRGKKGFLIGSVAICLLLIAIAFWVIPDWPQQMLDMLAKSGQRTDNNWNFTTFPNLLGLQENWSGTANVPLTALLILIGFLIVWKFRTLDTLSLLSFTLAASLFCAPRAYSYNFPLLVPAIIWVSTDLTKAGRLVFWLALGLIPFLFRFSTGTYLVVIGVFLWGIYKARKSTSILT